MPRQIELLRRDKTKIQSTILQQNLYLVHHDQKKFVKFSQNVKYYV